MNCKKGMATFLALAVAANATGAPVHAEGKSFLERMETLERANWTMVPWRNVLKTLGDLPEDIDKLDEFFLQDQYFDGNLTLAEKIFDEPRENFANYKGYNALNVKRVFDGKFNRYNLTNTCKLATTPEEISNEQEAYDAMMLEQHFDARFGDVCMSDKAVHEYQQQVAELLEGSWLDLVNGTDLMLHMKDGRVFNCADLLPAGLCKDLIRTFTEAGREAAERELREGLVALGGAIVALFVWKLTFDKGTTPTVSDGPADGPDDGSDPGGGGGSGSDDNDEECRKKALKTAKQNGEKKLTELNNAITTAGDKGSDKLTAANDLKTELENVINAPNATAETINTAAAKVDGVIAALNAAVEEAKKQEEKEKAEEEARQALDTAKQNGENKLKELTDAITAAGGKGDDKLTAANTLKNELENVINAPNATAETINTAAAKVDDVIAALNAAVEEERLKQEEERLKKEQQALEDAQTECRQAIEVLKAEINKATMSGVPPVTIQEAETLITTATGLLNNGVIDVIKQQIQALKVKTDALKGFIAEKKNAKAEKKDNAAGMPKLLNQPMQPQPLFKPINGPLPIQSANVGQPSIQQIQPIQRSMNPQPMNPNYKAEDGKSLFQSTNVVQSPTQTIPRFSFSFNPTQSSPETAGIDNSRSSQPPFSFSFNPTQNSPGTAGIDNSRSSKWPYPFTLKNQTQLKEENKEEIKEIEEIKEQQVEEKKEEQVEQIEQVDQMLNVEPPAVKIPLDADGRVQAAQAALQAAKADSKNKDLIEEKLELVNRLIEAQRQANEALRINIVDDPIMKELERIKAELEEMLNELEEQPKEDKEEPKKDGGDNGGQGNGNVMKEDKEKKDEKKEDEKKEDEKKEEKEEKDENQNQNQNQNQNHNNNINENHSHVGLAYVGNVVKNIPGCLFTKENLEAAAVTGLEAAASGTPAAGPVVSVAAIGYNTLKCAQEKADIDWERMRLEEAARRNNGLHLGERSRLSRLNGLDDGEKNVAKFINDRSKKFDEEMRLAANRGDMATLYGYDQNDLNNQVGTRVAMAAPDRM